MIYKLHQRVKIPYSIMHDRRKFATAINYQTFSQIKKEIDANKIITLLSNMLIKFSTIHKTFSPSA